MIILVSTFLLRELHFWIDYMDFLIKVNSNMSGIAVNIFLNRWTADPQDSVDIFIWIANLLTDKTDDF